jgi:histone H3/H4
MYYTSFDSTKTNYAFERAKKTEPKEPTDGNKLSIEMTIPDSLIQNISETASKEAISEIKKQVESEIFKRKTYYGESKFQEWAIDIFKKFLNENKNEIIKEAAHQLAESMKRSKTVREKFGDLLEAEIDNGLKETS